MNILYLQGLKSKKSWKNGSVYAPDIDFYKKHLQPEMILNRLPDLGINAVIGSSMGDLNGYFIADNIGRPALLFTPPLSKHQDIQFDARLVKLWLQKNHSWRK